MSLHGAMDVINGLGISDSEFASNIGIKPRTVERWRRGLTMPRKECRAAIADLLHLDGELSTAGLLADEKRGWVSERRLVSVELSVTEMLRLNRFDMVEKVLANSHKPLELG